MSTDTHACESGLIEVDIPAGPVLSAQCNV